MIIIKSIMVFLTIFYLFLYIRNINPDREEVFNFEAKIKYSIVGLVTNFFDFLGIGSFATQTLVFESDKRFDEKSYLIPGTLNVSNYIPTIIQALVLITILDIDMLTLVLLPVSAAGGSFIASRFIQKKNERIISLVLGVALVVTAILLFMNAFNIPPFNNIETGLNGLSTKPMLLVIAMISFFVLGMLQSFGLGIYAPGFALLGLMGLSYIYILPINMLSAASLSTTNCIEFIRKEKYIKGVSFYILIFGIIGVLLAVVFSYLIDFEKIIAPLQMIIALIALISGYKILRKKRKIN